MSRLSDLIAKAKTKNPQLGADLECEFRALSSRLSYGFNFDRQTCEDFNKFQEGCVEEPHNFSLN